MKLCGSCGFRNWELLENKKRERICSQCRKVIDRPIKNHVAACFDIQKELLPQSDERGNRLNYEN